MEKTALICSNGESAVWHCLFKWHTDVSDDPVNVCDSRHVMKELIETERIYVEELLAVLLVRRPSFFWMCHWRWSLKLMCWCCGFVYDLSHSICLDLQGYRAEMDNPSLAPLLPTSLRNKRDVLFGNLPDIYNFHSRQGHTQRTS